MTTASDLPPARNDGTPSKFVQRYFDTRSTSWAEYYQAQGATLSHLDLTARLAVATEMLGATLVEAETPPRILDAGCGTGEGTSRLGDVRAKVVAGDLSMAMVAQTIRRFPAVAGCTMDIAALPFASGSFDVVLALGALEYVHDERRALGEFRRMLRPGGSLILSIPNRASWFRRAHKAERALTLPLRRARMRLLEPDRAPDDWARHWSHRSWTLPEARASLSEARLEVGEFRLLTYGWLWPRAAGWPANLALCRLMNAKLDGRHTLARHLACTIVLRARAVE